MTLHTVHDAEAIAEALKAASLEDIAAELERRAKLCQDMGDDCERFAAHEDDLERKCTHESAGAAFYLKASRYRQAHWELLRDGVFR